MNPTILSGRHRAAPFGLKGEDRRVEEAIELYRAEGKPLPPATSGRDYANRMQVLPERLRVPVGAGVGVS